MFVIASSEGDIGFATIGQNIAEIDRARKAVEG